MEVLRKIIFFAALLFSAFSYGQLKKVELTPDEIDFIANNKANILGESLDNKDFDRSRLSPFYRDNYYSAIKKENEKIIRS